MERLACVEIPALPLQLFLREHRELAARPAAVVDCDKPRGTLLWVNEAARRHEIRPGLKYAAALARCADLRAGVIAPATIARENDALVERLRRHAPGVEPCVGEPGVFWLDARGMNSLIPSYDVWAETIRRELDGLGLSAGLVVGFRRFATYAIAKTVRARILVLEDAAAEGAAARAVPMERIGLQPTALAALAALGVRSVGDFVRLPAAGIRRRYGEAALNLHRLASGDLELPLDPAPPVEPYQVALELDEAELDRTRLLFVVKALLDRLLVLMHRRGEALAELELTLKLDHAAALVESIRPAAPTFDSAQIVGLVRLRLDAVDLPAGVVRVALGARGVTASDEQLAMFAPARPRRDLDAAAQAFARLRATFGDDVVVRARLAPGHLPEAAFTCEPIDHLPPAVPREVVRRPVVRRLLARPEPLPPREAREPDGWLVRGLEHGPLIKLSGPYRFAGGWWRTEIRRDYYFAELGRGALLWIFYDRRRRRWYLQGEVA